MLQSIAKLTPAELLSWWVGIISVLSLVNKLAIMPYFPVIARWVSAFISIPSGHLGNLIEDLITIWNDVTGQPPTASSGGSGGAIVTKPTNPPPPPAAAHGRIGFGAGLGSMLVYAASAGAVGATIVALSSTTACTPAQQAEFTAVENLVLQDLTAGKSRTQILEDVGQLLGGGVGKDIALIVADALALLIDGGWVPANVLPTAKAHLAALRASHADAGL